MYKIVATGNKVPAEPDIFGGQQRISFHKSDFQKYFFLAYKQNLRKSFNKPILEDKLSG